MSPRLRSAVDVEGVFLDHMLEIAEHHPAYLTCRTSQHRWPEEMPAFRVVNTKVEADEHAHKGETTYAKREVVCDRCATVRHDYYQMLTRRGRMLLVKLDSRYDYPPGYATKGLGRVDGARGLILGLQMEAALNDTPVRGRGRPKKES